MSKKKSVTRAFDIGKKEIIIALFVCLSVGAIAYSVGYASGVAWALNWGIDKGQHFLELKGVELDINTGLIAEGLRRYQNNIGGCWDIENKTQ